MQDCSVSPPAFCTQGAYDKKNYDEAKKVLAQLKVGAGRSALGAAAGGQAQLVRCGPMLLLVRLSEGGTSCLPLCKLLASVS